MTFVKKKIMKKIALLFTIAALVYGCKKDEKKEETPAPSQPYACATCNTSPEAVAGNDTKSGGVYKGILVGSTGTIKIVLQNGTSDVKAFVDFDDIKDTLTTTDLAGWNSGDPINNVTFTGKTITMTFSVAADGSSPIVNIIIPGHSNVTTSIAKETSTVILKCYEGTYTTTAGPDKGKTESSGTINYWVKDNQFIGKAKNSAQNEADTFTCTVDGTTVTGSSVNGTSISGTSSGDAMTGTWNHASSGNSGTWEGKRTL